MINTAQRYDHERSTTYPDGDLLPQGRSPATPATAWARHATAAAAGAAARVAVRPPRAQALCEACALTAGALGQAAVWLLNLWMAAQTCVKLHQNQSVRLDRQTELMACRT